MYVDQLSINITSTHNPVVGEGGTVQFTVTAGGVNEENFRYQWKRRGEKNIPKKAMGIDSAELTIPNLEDADEGKYFCIVINEWKNDEKSEDITLTVEGNKSKDWNILILLYVYFG